jgi:hypothetical protein
MTMRCSFLSLPLGVAMLTLGAWLAAGSANRAAAAEEAAAPAPQAPAPNVAGTYRCQAYELACARGLTFTVTQTGNRLDFQNENGDTGIAYLTSDVMVLAAGNWNMVGVILKGQNNTIQWTNGTRWVKDGG